MFNQSTTPMPLSLVSPLVPEAKQNVVYPIFKDIDMVFNMLLIELYSKFTDTNEAYTDNL